jgi:predicted ATP-dependent endonuclease of OLD family
MIRACNPVVNEFFFYDNIILVEGPTEQVTINHVAKQLDKQVHVIDCLGKANIPMFARILNQFQVPYTVVHDADTPMCAGKTGMKKNGMWTVNTSIRDAANARSLGRIYTQFPHFEGEHFGESLKSGKVDRVLEALDNPDSEDYKNILKAYSSILSGDVTTTTTSEEAFEKKRAGYISSKGLSNDPFWALNEPVSS